MFKKSILLIALLALGACAKGMKDAAHIASPRELKAMNDTSKKASVDAFMSEPRVMNEMSDVSATVKSMNLTTTPDDKYVLLVSFKNGSNITHSGQVVRDYDSTNPSSLDLDVGTVQIFKSDKTQQYCVTVDVASTHLAKGPSSMHETVCEQNIPAKK